MVIFLVVNDMQCYNFFLKNSILTPFFVFSIMIFLLLYFVNGCTTIIAENTNHLLLMYITKVMLMPLLAIYFYVQTREIKQYLHLYLALFFSWWGDIFLMFIRSGEVNSLVKNFFILGLISFLIGHVNYILHFLKEISRPFKDTLIGKKTYLLAPFLLFVLLLLKLLFPGLGSMKLPVTIYALVIVAMAVTALNRKEIVSNASFWLVFIGAILFVFSDSCIAINRFYQPFVEARVVIMSTYIVAQFCLVKGIVYTKKV